MSIFYKYFHGNAYNLLIFQHFFNLFWLVHCRGSCASFVWLKSFLRPLVRKILEKELPISAKNWVFHLIIKPPRLHYSFYGHTSFIISCNCPSDSTFEFSLSHLQPVLWPKTGLLSVSETVFLILCQKLGINPQNCKTILFLAYYWKLTINFDKTWITQRYGLDNKWIG